jgi:hypothetical protein
MFIQNQTNDGIFIQVLKVGDRNTIDEWIAHFDRVAENPPLRVVIDFSSDDVGFSPYLSQQVNGLFGRHGDKPGHVGIVVATSFGRQMAKLVLNRRRYQFEVRIVKSHDDALNWIRR